MIHESNQVWCLYKARATRTFDVLCQGLPCAGVVDAVSAPGGEELDQPGGGRVGDGGLEAAAAQDQQRVLLGVEAGGGSHTAGDEPQDERRLDPGVDHCSGTRTRTRTRVGVVGRGGTVEELGTVFCL